MTAVLNRVRYSSKQRTQWLYLLLIVVLIDLLMTVLFLSWSQTSMVIPKHLKADGAVLLFAGADNQTLNDESLRRVQHARDLYETGVVEEILSVGGYRTGGKPSGSSLYQNQLHRMGIPDRVLSKESLSYDTQTNINNALSIIEDKHWKSIVFVSSPTHLMRVRHYLQDRDINVNVYYSGYDYMWAQPRPQLLALWQRVHSEWAIYLMYHMLDEDQFNWVVREIRVGSQTASA